MKVVKSPLDGSAAQLTGTLDILHILEVSNMSEALWFYDMNNEETSALWIIVSQVLAVIHLSHMARRRTELNSSANGLEEGLSISCLKKMILPTVQLY